MGSEGLKKGRYLILKRSEDGRYIYLVYRFVTDSAIYLAKTPTQDFYTKDFNEAESWLEAMMLAGL